MMTGRSAKMSGQRPAVLEVGVTPVSGAHPLALESELVAPHCDRRHALTFSIVLDPDGRVMDLDDQAQRIMCLSLEDARRRRIWDCLCEDGCRQAREQLRDACRRAAGGEFVRDAISLRLVGQGSVCAECLFTPVPDACGRITHIVVVVGASTADALAPPAGSLPDTGKRFVTMANLIPAILWTAAANGSLTWVNDRWFEYTGLARDEDLSAWTNVIHADDLESTRHWEGALADGEEHEVEVRLRRHDGEYRWFAVRAVAVRDANGRIVEWCGSSTDIHERKQSEELRAFLAAIVESTDDAVITKTLDGRITSWNAAAERLFGYSASEAVGQPISLIIPPELAEEERAIIPRLASGERIEHYETVRLSKRGRRLTLSLTISPILDHNGRIIGASKVARDITDRKRSAVALARHAAQQSALYRFTDRLQRVQSERDIYDAALDAIGSVLECDRASILLVNDKGESRVAASRGLSDTIDRRVETQSPWAPDERHPRPLQFNDVRDANLDEATKAALQAEDIRALAFVPMTSGHAIVGGLVLYYEAAYQCRNNEIDLSLLIAHQLAFSLQRLRAEEHQRQADYARRESEERFARFMEHLPGLAWIKDPSGRYLFANQAAAEAFGVKAPDLLYRTDEQVFPPDTAATFRRNDREAMKSDTGVQVVETLEHGDGEIHHSLVTKFRIPGIDGGSPLVGGMAIDITAIKQAEEALRESERRFRLMADAAPVLIWVSDEHKQGVYFNERWLAFTGRLMEQELGDGWLDGIHPDDLQATMTACRTAFERREPFRIEFRLRRADGAYRWVLDHGVPRFTEDGRLAGYIGSCIDVTDRKQAEEALRVSEVRYKAAVETAMDCIIAMSADGRITAFNPAAERTFGYRPDEVIGCEMAEMLIPPELREAHRLGLRRWLESGESDKMGRRMEMPAIRKDGTRLIVELSIARTPGDPPSFTGFLRDVTEQKKTVEALKHSHEELERRVAERTSELQHRADQLARLASELTLTERRERQRLSRVLHDHIQQLLASGKLGIEFIARSTDETRRAEWIDHAKSCVDEAIEASRSLSIELHPPVLQEEGLAAGCEWLADWMKEKHGLTVDLDLDPQANPVREDVRTLLFESARELLFNVAKHAQVRRASLELALHEETSLCVVVSDQGAGFDLEPILDSGAHAGLGLFGIRERLALLGGRFEMHSEIGRGSRFTLIAPRNGRLSRGEGESDEPDKRPSEIANPPARTAIDRSDHIRVLVVDDHAVMRQGLCSLLAEETGLEVVGEASDGVEAIQKTRALEPDIVLMDFALPKMTGVEATHAIRRELPHVQVIALSMHREKEKAEAMIAAGAVAYINKSDDSHALIEAISKFGLRSLRGRLARSS